jgi:hypothetical protein
MIGIEDQALGKFEKFDNKEDAEHHAKNQSVADNKHIYEIQKNNAAGEFFKIKAYRDGQEV